MDYIKEICDRFVKKYKTRDPAIITEMLGINLWYRDLNELKGFYLYERKSRYIVVNNNLDEKLVKVIVAHELGHDTLHRTLARSGMREQTLFLDNDKTERQANIFAAELLIDDKEILSLLKEYQDYERVSYELSLPMELIGIKIDCLVRRGFKLNRMTYKMNFLK